MTLYGLIIPADLDQPARKFVLAEHQNQQLDQLQKIIRGFLEGLTLPDFHVYSDEDGKYKGLAPNTRITRLLRSEGVDLSYYGDYLCGTVILLGHTAGGEEDTLPARAFEAYSAAFGEIAEDAP